MKLNGKIMDFFLLHLIPIWNLDISARIARASVLCTLWITGITLQGRAFAFSFPLFAAIATVNTFLSEMLGLYIVLNRERFISTLSWKMCHTWRLMPSWSALLISSSSSCPSHSAQFLPSFFFFHFPSSSSPFSFS